MPKLFIRPVLVTLVLVCVLGTVGVVVGGVVVAESSYTIPWWTIVSGGGRSSGANYALSGTIGEPEASESLRGGSFTLAGGFQSGVGPAPSVTPVVPTPTLIPIPMPERRLFLPQVRR
jgi:hypothetical protein